MKIKETIDKNTDSILPEKNLINQFREQYYKNFLNKFNIEHNLHLTKEEIDNISNKVSKIGSDFKESDDNTDNDITKINSEIFSIIYEELSLKNKLKNDTDAASQINAFSETKNNLDLQLLISNCLSFQKLNDKLFMLIYYQNKKKEFFLDGINDALNSLCTEDKNSAKSKNNDLSELNKLSDDKLNKKLKKVILEIEKITKSKENSNEIEQNTNKIVKDDTSLFKKEEKNNTIIFQIQESNIVKEKINSIDNKDAHKFNDMLIKMSCIVLNILKNKIIYTPISKLQQPLDKLSNTVKQYNFDIANKIINIITTRVIKIYNQATDKINKILEENGYNSGIPQYLDSLFLLEELNIQAIPESYFKCLDSFSSFYAQNKKDSIVIFYKYGEKYLHKDKKNYKEILVNDSRSSGQDRIKKNIIKSGKILKNANKLKKNENKSLKDKLEIKDSQAQEIRLMLINILESEGKYNVTLIKNIINIGININKYIPLKHIIKYNPKEIIQFLIDDNEDLEARSELNDRYTILELAIYNDSKEIVKLLIKASVKLEQINSEGRTPLNFAIQFGSKETVELLIKAGVNLTETNTYINKTPLEFAETHEKYEIVKLLEKAINIKLLKKASKSNCYNQMKQEIIANSKFLRELEHYKMMQEIIQEIIKEESYDNLNDSDIFEIIQKSIKDSNSDVSLSDLKLLLKGEGNDLLNDSTDSDSSEVNKEEKCSDLELSEAGTETDFMGETPLI